MVGAKRFLVDLMALGLLVASLTACQKNDASADAKGPAEKAGQKIDEATARAGEAVNKAAEKTGEGMQELGQKLQKEAEQAQKKE